MRRVIIADDHPLMLSGIASMLRGTNYEIVAKATDGRAALDALASTRPDVLVLDVKMEGAGGMDVLRTLRSKGDPIPVVLLTAHLDDDTLTEALQLEVNGIIMKDGAETLILDCLGQVCTGKKWIDQSLLRRAHALGRRSAAAKYGPLAPLSPRERTIARLVAQGLRNRQIGQELGLTEGTVKVALHRIYEKLGIGRRIELAMMAKGESPDAGECEGAA